MFQVNQDDLEKTVEKLKQLQELKKKELKLITPVGSTAVSSPASQPASPGRQVQYTRGGTEGLGD